MNVRFFYQHFWPDSPPYATMLRTIGAHLAREGHDIGIVTGQPSYKAGDRASASPARESLDGIQVQRLPSLPGASRLGVLRVVQKALFPLRAALHLVVRRVSGERVDVVVAATIPPVINGLCAWAAARLVGARFVYHLQDIYPEIGAVGHLWSSDSLRYRVLRSLDTFVCKRADRCIVLSPDMREALVVRGLDGQNVVVINNVMLNVYGGAEPPSASEIVSPDGIALSPVTPRRIVFAGNLGRFQELDRLLGAFIAFQSARPVTERPVELHFLGNGAAQASLMRQAEASPHVHFHDHRPFAEAAVFIHGCDAGIVSIAPDVYRYAYPSKTLTYLGLGVPLFAVVESAASLATEIREHDLGVVSDHDAASLIDGFERLMDWLDSPSADRERLLAHHRAAFSTRATLTSWTSLAAGLAAPSPKHRSE